MKARFPYSKKEQVKLFIKKWRYSGWDTASSISGGREASFLCMNLFKFDNITYSNQQILERNRNAGLYE